MKAAEIFFIGFFAVIAAAIVFVQAGRQTNTSGGAQASNIISSLGGSLANVGSSLETGGH